jgi:hypothetical protein
MVRSGTFVVNEGCINPLLLIGFIQLIQVLLKKMKVVRDYG